MVFKTTSTKRRKAGLSLVEMMVALGVGFMLLAMISGLSIYSGRSFAALANYADLDNKSRNALDHLTRDVRQIQTLQMCTPRQLAFLDENGHLYVWLYNPTARTLTRRVITSSSTQSSVFLTECDFLEFSYFTRNAIAGTYDVFPAATLATTKLIQVSWISSRRVLGTRMHTESVQTAKIVIRKK
jgi:hypothetical protein